VLDAVWFDFNGVLVDDESLHLAAVNEVLAPLGVHMSDTVYAERYLGFDDRGAFTAVLQDHARPAPAALLEDLIARKAAVYARRATTELRIFPGAAEVLAALAARVPVAIVSGALRAEITGALAVMGLQTQVSYIVAAEDVSACKPDPEGYERACAWLAGAHPGVARSRVVAIEDSLAGIESARAAGLAVAAVAHTYEPAALSRAGAHPVFPRIADVSWQTLLAALAPAR
jgi:HAD superfamily hydrolase (TIGR01509 family)